MQENSNLEDRVSQIEQTLDEMTQHLLEELKDLANIVRGGSNEAIAEKIELIARIPCEHWPNCFDSMDKEEAC